MSFIARDDGIEGKEDLVWKREREEEVERGNKLKLVYLKGGCFVPTVRLTQGETPQKKMRGKMRNKEEERRSYSVAFFFL